MHSHLCTAPDEIDRLRGKAPKDALPDAATSDGCHGDFLEHRGRRREMGEQRIPHWRAVAVAAAFAASLAACGGGTGDAGPPGPPGVSGPSAPASTPGTGPPPTGVTINVGSNALTDTTAINANAKAWADLQPTVTITSVSVAGPPVVRFTV